LKVEKAHAAQLQQNKNLQKHTTTHQKAEATCMKENEGMQQKKKHLTVDGNKYPWITSKSLSHSSICICVIRNHMKAMRWLKSKEEKVAS